MVPPRRRRHRSGRAAGSRSAQGSGRAGPRRPGAPLEGDVSGSGPPPTPPPLPFIADPITGATAEVHRIQPFEARKDYVCPGCNQEIRRGTGHTVIVPLNAADLRRHWHDPCLARARRHGLP